MDIDGDEIPYGNGFTLAFTRRPSNIIQSSEDLSTHLTMRRFSKNTLMRKTAVGFDNECYGHFFV